MKFAPITCRPIPCALALAVTFMLTACHSNERE